MPEELFVTIYTGPGRAGGRLEGRVARGCIRAAGLARPGHAIRLRTLQMRQAQCQYKATLKLENFVRGSV